MGVEGREGKGRRTGKKEKEGRLEAHMGVKSWGAWGPAGLNLDPNVRCEVGSVGSWK